MLEENKNARWFNLILGAWLIISAYLWRHSPEQFTNAWVVGVLCVAIALIAMAAPVARYLNTALAVWLFISAFALETLSPGTAWNSVIVAIVLFAVSMVGPEQLRRARRTREPKPA